MELFEKPLKIEVSGGDVVTNTLVFGLISEVLGFVGFENVETITPQGDVETPTGDSVRTLLDSLICASPGLFATPVTVKQNLTKATAADPTENPTISALEQVAKVVVYGKSFIDIEPVLG